MAQPTHQSAEICAAFPAMVLASTLSMTASAQFVDCEWPQPSLDRWMYPFNSSPGSRPTISVFGSDANDPTMFDSRDGQFLMAWNTNDQFPSGLPVSTIQVLEARVEIEFENNLVVAYDPTQDPWQMFRPTSDPLWQADPDAGQSIELFGTGFRNGQSASSFQEFSPYAPGGTNLLASGVRSAFAMSFDGAGNAIDVSNHPREGFDPLAFGVGTCATLSPGDLIPAGTRMVFDINVAHPAIQQYLRTGLHEGRLFFTASSLTFVVQQGGNYPAFYAKEHAYVGLGAASAARLTLRAQVAPACEPADIDCNGSVDGADLGMLLSNWGGTGSGDVDDSGAVDGADLGTVLSAWTG